MRERRCCFRTVGKKAASPSNRIILKTPNEVETPFIPQLCGNNRKHPVYAMDAAMRTIDADENIPLPTIMASPTQTTPFIHWKAIAIITGKIAASRTLAIGVVRRIIGKRRAWIEVMIVPTKKPLPKRRFTKVFA